MTDYEIKPMGDKWAVLRGGTVQKTRITFDEAVAAMTEMRRRDDAEAQRAYSEKRSIYRVR